MAQPRPPGRGRIFGAATPPGAQVHVKKIHVKKVTVVTVLNVFCTPRPYMSQKPTKFLEIAVPLRTAVLQLPLKSYENRPKRSAFVHFSRNGGN